MSRYLRMRLRYTAAVLVVVGLYLADNDGLLVGTTAVAAPRSEPIGNCDQDCGPSVTCEEQCWSYIDQGPPFLTTCGEYSGPPWDGYGNCIGECGDDYCNEYNNEDPDTCYEDCGECGDNICTESGGEDVETCLEDCLECGDDICTRQGGETCNSCPGDCDPLSEGCGVEGDPGDPCETGKFINGSGYCCEAWIVGDLSNCSYCFDQCIEAYSGGEPTGNYLCVARGAGCESKAVAAR